MCDGVRCVVCSVCFCSQSLAFLKSEIAELQRQKLEEVEKFEEYRREEMRKLR